jgi:hypothetical protein
MPNYAASPRFVMYSKQSPDEEAYYSIVVLELMPEVNYGIPKVNYGASHYIPFSNVKKEHIKQVLLQTSYLNLHDGEGGDEDHSSCIREFIRAERVVTALNNMDLALQAAELEPDGIKNLFDQLWSSDQL